MKVIFIGEFSGVGREEFAVKGHDAWSCDLLPTEIPSEKHHMGDGIEFLKSTIWDLIIAHPPCTYLCNSGVRWLYNRDGSRYEPRWDAMRAGAKFFADLWNACGDTPRGFENPVMHCHAQMEILRLAPTCPMGPVARCVQPWEHGHPESKATRFYTYKLPPLKPSNVVYEEFCSLSKAARSRIHYASPSPERGKNRSRTYPGIAKAMAEQWGVL